MSDNKSDQGKTQLHYVKNSMPSIMLKKGTQMNAEKEVPPLPAQSVSRPPQTKSETSTSSNKN